MRCLLRMLVSLVLWAAMRAAICRMHAHHRKAAVLCSLQEAGWQSCG